MKALRTSTSILGRLASMIFGSASPLTAGADRLTKAQVFMLDLIGDVGDIDYKAPHALRGTPKKAHLPRTHRQQRLFKGHRP